MNDSSTRQARYPLRAVMRRTGLSADVIRAWERRYAAVEPQRSPGGQRLYSELDVLRLGLMRRATAQGHSIGEIARLDMPALEAIVHAARDRATTGQGDSVSSVVAEALADAEQLDAAALEATLKRAALTLGADRFVDEVVSRFLADVGTRWHLGSLSSSHEHLASAIVRRVLTWVSEAYRAGPNAPSIVIATPPGELHELGAMTVAVAALGEGWRVVYLGPNLPGREIAQAASQVGARIVAISLTYVEDDVAERALLEVAHGLPDGVDLVIGGAAVEGVAEQAIEMGAQVLPDIDSLRKLLRSAVAVAGDRGIAAEP